MDSLVTLSQGDMRRALNILQSTSMAHDEVNEVTVYLCTGQPLPSDIATIVEWMLNLDFSTAYISMYIYKCVYRIARNIGKELNLAVGLLTLKLPN